MTATLSARITTAGVTVPAVPAPPAVRSDVGPPIEVLSFPAMEPGGTGGSVVVAAVDNDGNPATVISYAAACARELEVPLRVTYVWSSNNEPFDFPWQGGPMPDADLMLSTLLYDCAANGGSIRIERALLHDTDPASALVALSRNAVLMVVSASSSPRTLDRPLGDTVRGLAGRTRCPLLVVIPESPTGPHLNRHW